MEAMILKGLSQYRESWTPLESVELPIPEPGRGEILLKVSACGVCHTELDEIEGRTPPPRFPVIPGHQVVGRVEKNGPGASAYRIGDRVGVGWIYSSCGQCRECREGRENLCSEYMATGRDVHGGYAQYMVVPESFAIPIPELFSDIEAAPLLCAGAIGYRSLRLTGLEDGQNLGLTGFGASAHLVLKMVRQRYPSTDVYVFARSAREQDFARQLGAVWAGDTTESSPRKLAAIIDTTPAWKPIVEALRNLEKGGRLVINAIRKEESDKSELLNLDYPDHLWLEKEIKSVANVTRQDIREFLALAAEIPLHPETQEYELHDANRALAELKEGKVRGGKVLVMR
ncbi:alcohol dehydrogenase, propanol-preferring [Syntrophus gentianae]|uniref:alcohol dehydrogenase n=1 Tax=Syntrophus gentianae TaxID=43775 RepID=A0A1H7UP74_9BACT|nr:zinc-dependent alcohol dehydrogenase family protein [Syntrophus gentianae]SEL98753.1 alcohol dehydrogenase, propanol-preferring [Syntrophus gentianae]